MQSVQQLFDNLGEPPPDICLDWAWQLLDFAEVESIDFTPTGAGGHPTDWLAELTWSSVYVSADGRLSLAATTTVGGKSSTVLGLIDQLLSWSGAGLEHLADIKYPAAEESLAHSLQSRRTVLLQLTGQQASTAQSNGLSPIANLPVGESEPVSTNEISAESGNTQSSSTAEPDPVDSQSLPVTANSTAVELLPQSANRKRRTRVSHRTRYSVATIAGLILLGSLGYFFSKDWLLDRPASLATPTTQSKNATVAGSPKVLPGQEVNKAANDSGPIAISPEQDGLLGTAEVQLSRLDREITEGNLSADIGKELHSNRAASTLSTGSSAVTTLSANAPQPGADPATTTNPQSQSALPPGPEQSAEAKGEQPEESATEKPQVDLASLVASVAANEPKINNLEQEASQLPVQLLAIDSMLQVQEFPKLRVRQPLWELRISTTKAFAVEPATAQVLGEKQTLLWTLLPKEAKPRKDQLPTRVVVFAQLSGRRADIKWKIAAVCDDLPGMALPLDDEKLDKLLTMLQTYQQQLAATIDALKTQTDATGLQRDHRTSLSRNRRELEAEVKRVIRARQFIADAGLFAGWMDRTIEVHGRLFENLPSQKNELLNIGEPSGEGAGLPETNKESSDNSSAQGN